ncbi:hypothetical protein V6N13_042057 [Hibiscus sabdariffa]
MQGGGDTVTEAEALPLALNRKRARVVLKHVGFEWFRHVESRRLWEDSKETPPWENCQSLTGLGLITDYI